MSGWHRAGVGRFSAAPMSGTQRSMAAASAQGSADVGTLLRWCVAMLSLGAGVVHLSVAPEHFGESALHGSFFATSGAFQLLTAALLLVRPSRVLLAATGLANAAVIGTWIVSRTAGFPFLPGGAGPEPVGLKDGTATLFEVLIVGAVAFLLNPSATSRLMSWGRARAALAGAGTLLLLMTALAFSPIAAESDNHHSSGHEATGSGHAHPGALDHGKSASHTHLAETPSDAPAHDAHASRGAGSGADGHDLAPADADAGHVHFGPSTASHAHASPAKGASAGPQPGPAEQAPATPVPGGGADDLRTSVRYGPFVLPPASLGGTVHHNIVLANVPKPCSDCYITGFSPDLVYQDGSPANHDTGPMLHHAVWTRPQMPDATCTRNGWVGLAGQRFFAAGNERTGGFLPAGFGYHVGQDPWTLVAEIMNHSEAPKVVFATLDVTYRPGSDRSLKPVTPMWLDVDNCNDSEYTVPAGPSHVKWDWTSSLTGRIVAAAGHVHNGGIKTVLTNETTSQQICTSVAGYGTKPAYMGNIESMSGCSRDALGTVRAGEVLALHSYYNSPETRNDVMGIMIAYIYETTDLQGESTSSPSQPPAPTEAPPPAPGHQH